MKVVFSRRALNDIRSAAAFSRREFGGRVAAALEARIRAVVAQLSGAPESAPRVDQRPNVRAVSLGRYPYRLFYRVAGEEIVVLHIRHAARRDP